MTCFLCCYVILDGCIVIKEEFFMTCCIRRVLHLRGSIHFLIVVHAFLSSMLSGGVHVFRGSLLHMLRGELVSSVFSFAVLLIMCSCLGCVEPFSKRCLWWPRFFQVGLAFVMPLMQVILIFAFMWSLFTWIWVLLDFGSLRWDFWLLPLKPFLMF